VRFRFDDGTRIKLRHRQSYAHRRYQLRTFLHRFRVHWWNYHKNTDSVNAATRMGLHVTEH